VAEPIQAATQAATQAILAHPIFPLGLTLAAYAAGSWLHRRSGQSPFLHPLILAVAIVIVVLQGIGMPYATYFEGTRFLHWMLGPAIVALAIPLYGELTQLRARWRSTLAALLVGSVVATGSAVLVAWALGGSQGLLLALSTKSVTTALATVLAQEIGSNPAIAAAIVLVTGLLGAVVGPWLFARLRPGDDAALGTALGTCAHAIGTSRAIQLSEACGAFAALSMGLNGLLTALVLPALMRWLQG
jgi:predicted murein hydrolase (TIGR00659 family)